jgi:hypothetical protein
MGVSSRIRRSALAATATVLLLPAAAGAAMITFEDLSPHPPPTGTGGLTVNTFYNGQGVTFNNPSAFDYGGGFAHSGVVGVEPCVGQEFCSSPVRVDFTTGQTSVGAWVGFSFAPTPAFPIRLTAYDGSSNVVAIDNDTVPASSGRTPIQIHLSVGPGPPTIRSMEISVPGGFTGGMAVDDIEFSTAGPPPPCTASAPPTVTLTQPGAFTTFHNNEFPLAGSVDNHGAPITSATISATSESHGARTANLFPALIPPDGGGFNVRFNGFMYAPVPDLHDITLSATNCAGTGTSDTRRVFWNPLPAATRFQQEGVIEVTQAVQTPLNSVPLIAGKRTFARVYLRVEGGAFEVRHVTGTLTATLPDGSQAPGPTRTYSINKAPAYGYLSSGPIAEERSRIDDPLLFELPSEWTRAGRIHLQLEHISVEGAESHFPCDDCDNVSAVGIPPVPGPSTVRFHDAPPLRVWLVGMPYRPSPNGTPITPSQLEIDTAASLLRRMYPTAQVRVNQASLPIADGPPETCVEARGLISQWGQSLAAQDHAVRFLGLLEGQPDMEVKDSDGNVIGGCASGQFGWVYADDEIGAAHELGHTFGLRHVRGCQLFAGSSVDAYPHPLGLIGDLSFGDALGFDAGDSSVPAPMRIYDWRDNYTDVMTYCAKKWISDFNYGRILGRLCDEDVADCPDHTAITGHSRRRGEEPKRAAEKRRPPRLSVIGMISGRRGSLDSVAIVDDAALTPRPKKSPYAIVLRDAHRRAIARYPFKPNEIGEERADAIEEVVPFKRTTRQIAVVAGHRVLASAKVSAHAPTVAVTAPGGGKAGKRVTVRWRSHDADGGRLTYTVLYSPGGGRSIPIAAGIRKNSLRVGLASLPGSRHGRFEVIADDGVLTGNDTSEPLKVRAKRPSVSISAPATGAELAADQPVELVASVTDLQDVPFRGSRIAWTSSLQGNLGTGATLAATLTPGTHEVTATATNSAGKSAAASVTVQATAPPPVFSVGP